MNPVVYKFLEMQEFISFVIQCLSNAWSSGLHSVDSVCVCVCV
jgi:hypothetical protein